MESIEIVQLCEDHLIKVENIPILPLSGSFLESKNLVFLFNTCLRDMNHW